MVSPFRFTGGSKAKPSGRGKLYYQLFSDPSQSLRCKLLPSLKGRAIRSRKLNIPFFGFGEFRSKLRYFISGNVIIPRGGHILAIVAKAVQTEYRHKLDYAF